MAYDKNTITRWFVYTKKANKNRYSSIAVYDTKEEAEQEAKKYIPSYIKGFNCFGNKETDKIIING